MVVLADTWAVSGIAEESFGESVVALERWDFGFALAIVVASIALAETDRASSMVLAWAVA